MPTPRALPGLGIYGFWPLGSDAYKDQLDSGLRMLSVLVQLAPLSKSTSLPGSPSQGQIYIVPSGEQVNKVAVYDDSSWVYLTPAEGWRAWVKDVNKLFTYRGTTWVEFSSEGADLPDITGMAGRVLTVSEGEDGLNWVLFPGIPEYDAGDAGKVLRVNLDGNDLEWAEQSSGGGSTSPIAVNTYTSNRTLAGADANAYSRMSSASSATFTVPADATYAFDTGTVIQLRRVGAGSVTIAKASGVTINTPSTLTLRAVGSSAALIKVGADEWDLTGDLEASGS